MKADDEEPQFPGDAQKETLEAEVAVGHPQRAFLDQLQDGIDQRTLLGMTVSAQDDLAHQLNRRLEDARGLPRQGGGGAVVSRLTEAVSCGGNGVAIEGVHLIAGDWLWQGAADLLDKRL